LDSLLGDIIGPVVVIGGCLAALIAWGTLRMDLARQERRIYGQPKRRRRRSDPEAHSSLSD
jgi:hypothetical protein